MQQIMYFSTVQQNMCAIFFYLEACMVCASVALSLVRLLFMLRFSDDSESQNRDNGI